MPIRVTCPGCRTRFNVSEKFAGRDGPCPKCRAKIRIPDKSEEVVIHAPADTNPKIKMEASIARPIFRREVVITPLIWTVIIGVIATFFFLALVLRWQISDKANFPLWLLVGGAWVVAIPSVYAAYGMLRDGELEGFLGRELWIRILVCASLYAALWLAMPATKYALHGYDTITWSIAMASMIALGGAVAMSVLDFDYLSGILHYGLYLGCTLLLRWIMDVGVFPGQSKLESASALQAIWSVSLDWIQRLV